MHASARLTLALLSLFGCADPPPNGEASPAETGDGGAETDGGEDTDGGSGDGGSDGGEDTGADDTGDPLPPPPAYVILFIGDGMGFNHVAGGGMWVNGEAGSLVMETAPHQGRLRTASFNGTTDSAASCTALTSGHKTWNSYLGLTDDGRDTTSLIDLARSRGMSTGVVTTDTVTGATPAATIVHLPDRYATADIADAEVANLPDLLLGGGALNMDERVDGEANQVVRTAAELGELTPDGRPIVGLFNDATFPYIADGYAEEPTLAEMTGKALEILGENPDGMMLLVEGARIDHASHIRSGWRAMYEVEGLDAAVATALAWGEGRDDVTVLVTADHECGGLELTGEIVESTQMPEMSFRWGSHTNADVPVFGWGPGTEHFDGERLDNPWVHAALSAVLEGRDIVAPDVPPIVDGWPQELGDRVSTQTHESDYGPGFNQLDGMRVWSDEIGLRVGLDGVYEVGENTVTLLIDLDFGDSSGFGGDGDPLDDETGILDSTVSALQIDVGVDGLGFDVAVASMGAEEINHREMHEQGGGRGVGEPWRLPGDLFWLHVVTAFDDGNLALGAPARDAGDVGVTEGGWEILVPWESLFDAGLPAEGLDIALVAVLSNRDGDHLSNQALPPYASSAGPADGAAQIESAVLFSVDATGAPLAPAAPVR